MKLENNVYEKLTDLKIEFKVIKHKPLFTMEDASTLEFKGIQPKNLLLKDKKNNQFYLLILMPEKNFNSKIFREITKASNKITFASEDELFEKMHVKKGACSIFGILNNREIHLVIDNEILKASDEEKVNFHPNVNDKTVELSIKDLKIFLDKIENQIIYY